MSCRMAKREKELFCHLISSMLVELNHDHVTVSASAKVYRVEMAGTYRALRLPIDVRNRCLQGAQDMRLKLSNVTSLL